MMDIGNLFKNHVSLNGEEMDKRENFLKKSFIYHNKIILILAKF